MFYIYLVAVSVLFLYAFSDDISDRLARKKIKRMARKLKNKKGSDAD